MQQSTPSSPHACGLAQPLMAGDACEIAVDGLELMVRHWKKGAMPKHRMRDRPFWQFMSKPRAPKNYCVYK